MCNFRGGTMKLLFARIFLAYKKMIIFICPEKDENILSHDS